MQPNKKNDDQTGTRTYCLYRVSTKQQVDIVHDDIPDQRKACHEFIEKQGWELVGQISEKGISGFKVSAQNRDAIQLLQEKARQKEFDILLVFMFDRLGRKEDETPFVVEWFTKQGIRVWSVQEGEQRFDTHVDKLLNYIRYWQAAGESEKTSIRIKNAFLQMTREGHYHGGSAPYGYESVCIGRMNKKAKPVKDLRVLEHEANIVQLVFDKYVNEGMGTHTLGGYLHDRGITNRNGGVFTTATIRHMLLRSLYTGRIRCGETESDLIPELQIIDDALFERAQQIIQARSVEMKDTRSIPRTTVGASLLSGNIFCGHCGSRMVSTSNGKTRVRKDGSEIRIQKHRYYCYGKTRHHLPCEGQTGYTSSRIDIVIDKIIRTAFEALNDTPATRLVNMHYQAKATALTKSQEKYCNEVEQLEKEMERLKNELHAILLGTSDMPKSFLSSMIQETEQRMSIAKVNYLDASQSVEHLDSQREVTRAILDEILNWGNLYDQAVLPVKKMIASSLVQNVTIHNGYRLQIRLSHTFTQFLWATNKFPKLLEEKMPNLTLLKNWPDPALEWHPQE